MSDSDKVLTADQLPKLLENDTRVKLNEVRRRTVKAAKLWLDLYTACANGDAEGARQIWTRIRDASVEASDILKSVGTGEQKP